MCKPGGGMAAGWKCATGRASVLTPRRQCGPATRLGSPARSLSLCALGPVGVGDVLADVVPLTARRRSPRCLRWTTLLVSTSEEVGNAHLHLTHQVDPPGCHQHQGGTSPPEAGKDTLKAFGSELKAFYLTMGRYDLITISEAADEMAAAKVALAIGSAGNVTTETLRAFTEDEYREIVNALP